MKAAAVAAPKAASAALKPAASGLLLQGKCACGATAGASGQCDACRKKRNVGVQAKMRIGAAGDAFELEADRVADRVMAMSAPRYSGDTQYPASEPLVQRRTADDASPAFDEVPSVVNEELNAPGAPLDAASRSFFEPRFGHDFSRVRVHADSAAARSADAVGALAFTVGHHIVFAANQYASSSASSNRLLAHELTHVVQQQGAASRPNTSVLRRQPAQSRRMGMILSLKEIATDAGREKKRTNSGQSEAKVYRDTNKGCSAQNCPATLAPGTLVTIVKETVGGLWIRIDATGVPGVGPVELVYVLSAFVKEVPSAVDGPHTPVVPPPSAAAQSAKQEEAPPDPKRVVAKRVAERYVNLPKEAQWQSPPGKGQSRQADSLMKMMIAAHDFYCNEPHDREAGDAALKRVKEITDSILTDKNFRKHYGHMNFIGQKPLKDMFNAGISGITQIMGKIKAGQVSEGACGGTFKFHLDEFKASYEVLAVLSGDVGIKDTRQTKQLETITSFKPAKAFADGVLAGAKSELVTNDYERLASKLSDSATLSALMPAIIGAGTVVGIAKDLVEAVKGIYEFVTSPVEMATQMLELISILMTDEEGSRALGEAIGAQQANELKEMSHEDAVTFTYNLGELVGPTVVYTVLSIVTGGAAGGAVYSARLAKFLEKYPKVAAQIKRIRALLPEKKHKPGADAPDAPHGNGGPDKTDASPNGNGDDSASSKNHDDGTPPGKRTVAEHSEDGHSYKVLADGSIIRCSTCGEIMKRVEGLANAPAADKKRMKAWIKELEEIEAITDPKLKAKKAAEFDRQFTAAHGPGEWMDDFAIENMSDAAKAYQSRVTGAQPGKGYCVNNVQFDGFDSGKLIDAKGYTDGGRFERDRWYQFNKAWDLLDDANRQLKAAGGAPIEWRVAGKEPTKLIRQLFKTHNINISVVHK